MIFVIVPVHNRSHMTRRCLNSIGRQTFEPISTIVVDDGSTDGTSEMIIRDYPDAILVSGDGTMWWTGATNRGVRAALERGTLSDSVLLLNNDTEVDPHFVESLVKSAAEHERRIVGSVLVNYETPGRIIDGGVRINWLTAKYHRLNRGKEYEEALFHVERFQPVDVLTGRGTLVPLTVFRTVGLFDEVRFPHYGADYEFFHRARNSGYELVTDYRSVVKSTNQEDPKTESYRPPLSSLRSSFNPMIRLRFALRCCPWYLLPSFVFFDAIRILFRITVDHAKTLVRDHIAERGPRP